MSEYPFAKSICKCGHTGDGHNSEHASGIINPGHGHCLKCACEWFSWARWNPPYEAALIYKDKAQKEDNDATR